MGHSLWVYEELTISSFDFNQICYISGLLHKVGQIHFFQVIHWCTYHKDDPPPPEDDENKEKRTDDICSWDAEFLKVDQGTLFELILVSH